MAGAEERGKWRMSGNGDQAVWGLRECDDDFGFTLVLSLMYFADMI